MMSPPLQMGNERKEKTVAAPDDVGSEDRMQEFCWTSASAHLVKQF